MATPIIFTHSQDRDGDPKLTVTDKSGNVLYSVAYPESDDEGSAPHFGSDVEDYVSEALQQVLEAYGFEVIERDA